MNKQAAIGLSMNVLVVIIISVVILAGGITLLYRFIAQAEEIKSHLDIRTEAELERLLIDQGKKVALPLHTVTLRRGDSHTFGLGIANIGDVGNQFQLGVELSRVLQDGAIVPLTDTQQQAIVQEWVLYNDDPLIIEEAAHHKEAIFVQVPENVPNGQYIFNVKVQAGGIQYGTTQRFYVTLKD